MLWYVYVSAMCPCHSVTSAAAVFAVAVVAFFVLSIVCAVIVKAEIVGVELHHPLSLHSGARRQHEWQCRHATHLDVCIVPPTIAPSSSIAVVLLAVFVRLPPWPPPLPLLLCSYSTQSSSSPSSLLFSSSSALSRILSSHQRKEDIDVPSAPL